LRDVRTMSAFPLIATVKADIAEFPHQAELPGSSAQI